MKLLQNKLVLIAGGADGLGKALVECFASHDCRVAVLDNDEGRLNILMDEIKGRNQHIKTWSIDITKDQQVAQVAHELAVSGKQVDILINAAGLSIMKIGEEESWRLKAAAVLKGARNVIREFSDNMEGGCIVNIVPFPERSTASGATLYTSLKAGIQSLTTAWARQLGPAGNRVNAILPGFFEETEGNISKQSLKSLKEKIPAGRLGTFSEIAEIIVFLSSPQAEYISGSLLPVDGGFFS